MMDQPAAVIDCPHRSDDGVCGIVSSHSPVRFSPPARICRQCTDRTDSPQSLNQLTAKLVVVQCRMNGAEPEPSIVQIADGQSSVGGPGTELKKLLSWFASEKPGCQCKDRQLRMDRWGPKKCRDNIETIVGWLANEAKQRYPLVGGAIPKTLIRSVVATAIDRAEGKQSDAGVAKALSDYHQQEAERRRQSHADWFIGITTAPRKEPTLHECVDSIRLAGWEPTIFAEPGSPQTDCRTIHNETQQGVWRNWYGLMQHALTTNAKYVLTFQDDVVIHPDTRQIVEREMDSIEGFLSLYTMRKYGRMRPNGIVRIYTKSLWGACALAFPRSVAQMVVDHPIAKNWLGATPRTKATREQTYQNRKNNPWRIGNSDTAIGKVMNALELPMMFVNPSPAVHIAQFSAMGHGGNQGNRNCDPCADFSKPLMQQVRCDS